MATSGMVQHAHNIFGVLGLSFADFTRSISISPPARTHLASGAVDASFQCPLPTR